MILQAFRLVNDASTDLLEKTPKRIETLTLTYQEPYSRTKKSDSQEKASKTSLHIGVNIVNRILDNSKKGRSNLGEFW